MAQPSDRARTWSPRGPRPRAAATVAASMLLALVVALGVVGAAVAAAPDGSSRLVAGTTVAGVDVGGMRQGQAVDAVAARLDQRLQQPVAVAAGERRLSVTRAEVVDRRRLGAEVRAAVEAAVDQGRELSALQRARAQWLNEADVSADVDVAVDDAALASAVDGLATQVQQPAADAQVTLVDNWVELEEGHAGQQLDQAATADRLRRAVMRGQRRIEAPMTAVDPGRTVDDFPHVLLLRQNERRLYHYVDGEIAAQWPVAVGTGGHPTPTGWFMVGTKRPAPVWVNPAPDGWGADRPERIEAGPNNPLGLRALNWRTADGGRTLIRFHGTAATSSIGTAASHGCVRLTNDDVVELFEQVSTGTPIVSVRG